MRCFLFTLTILLSNTAWSAEGADPARQSNVVIIYADDLGYGDIGCYNAQSKIQTPHVDALAQEGVRFTDAHSGHSVCTPSRYSLLTGRYPWRGACPWGVIMAWESSIMQDDLFTMGELFQSSGYETLCVGKWHLGWNWPEPFTALRENHGVNIDFSQPITGGPTEHGFDYYFGEDVINMPPYIWYENDRCVTLPDSTGKNTKGLFPGPMAKDFDPAEVLVKDTQKAVELIQKRKNSPRPFFLYFSLPSPHMPHLPSPEFQGATKMGPYGDYVVQSDDSVGQVVAALKETGAWEHTIVVFTSDNGSHMHQLADKGHATNGDYRGGKWTYWEGGHRVPFIVRWPGRVVAGTENHQLVSQIDLMATFADWLDRPLPEGSAPDSLNLMPTLEQPEVGVRDELVLTDVNHRNSWAIRVEEWKYCEDIRNSRDRKPGEPATKGLYNVKEDPGESVNLAKQFPERVELMQKRIDEYKALYRLIHTK